MTGIDIERLRRDMGESARPLHTLVRGDLVTALVATGYIAGDRAFWGYVAEDGEFVAMELVPRSTDLLAFEVVA